MDGIRNQNALSYEDVLTNRKLRGTSNVTIIANLRAFSYTNFRLIEISSRITGHRVKPAPSPNGDAIETDMLGIVESRRWMYPARNIVAKTRSNQARINANSLEFQPVSHGDNIQDGHLQITLRKVFIAALDALITLIAKVPQTHATYTSRG